MYLIRLPVARLMDVIQLSSINTANPRQALRIFRTHPQPKLQRSPKQNTTAEWSREQGAWELLHASLCSKLGPSWGRWWGGQPEMPGSQEPEMMKRNYALCMENMQCQQARSFQALPGPGPITRQDATTTNLPTSVSLRPVAPTLLLNPKT